MTNGDIGVRVCPIDHLRPYTRHQTDFLPMDFDLSKIKHFMLQKQREHILSKRIMTNVSSESQHLKQYGKCRFDYALSKSSGSDWKTRCTRQRPSTCPVSSQRQNKTGKRCNRDSGPSREGSVIYNKKALILSAIRTRPSTVQSDRHQETNRSVFSNGTSPIYRLKVANSFIDDGSVFNQSTVNYSDIILLPEDSCSLNEFLVDEKDKDVVFETSVNKPGRSGYRKPSIPVLFQIDAPDSSDDDSEDDMPNSRLLRPNSRGSGKSSPRLSANRSGDSRGRKKSPSSSGREGIRGKTADTLSPASAGRRSSSAGRGRGKAKVTGTGKDRRNTSGGRRTLRDDSPTRIPLPGPHCWVDDVTVSSDVIGEEERGESPFVDIAKPSLYSRPRDKALPDFLCPSSELKSRNVATKMWIRESSFLKADKVLPLV